MATYSGKLVSTTQLKKGDRGGLIIQSGINRNAGNELLFTGDIRLLGMLNSGVYISPEPLMGRRPVVYRRGKMAGSTSGGTSVAVEINTPRKEPLEISWKTALFSKN